MITIDRLLNMVAAEAGRHGLAVPQLDSEQARRAAQALLAAVGLERTDGRQRALPPAPPPPARRVVDAPTQLLSQITPEAGRPFFQVGRASYPGWARHGR